MSARLPTHRPRRRVAAAIADDSPLSDAERSARAGLTNRQVTLR